MSDEEWMRRAIEVAESGITAGQTPFGACIVRGEDLVVAAHNVVWLTTDVTAHAEVTAIRRACGSLSRLDLSGCAIYSTCEPCPMCFAAIHWARINRIVYGASIADAQAVGFNELPVSNTDLKRLGGSRIDIAGGVLKDECRALFERWKRQPGTRAY